MFVCLSVCEGKKEKEGVREMCDFHGSSGALARDVEENITAVVSLKDFAVHFNKQL